MLVNKGKKNEIYCSPIKKKIDEEDNLDVPYDQDWEENKRVNLNNLGSSIRLEPLKKTEPLQVGDVISYHHLLYVAGSKDGLHEATVIAINDKNEKTHVKHK